MSKLLLLGSSFLQQVVFKWPATPEMVKVDTHHHYVPEFYAEGKSNTMNPFYKSWALTLDSCESCGG